MGGSTSSNPFEEARCYPAEEFLSVNFDRSDWMGNLSSQIENTRLVDVAMPGTHHSATYSIISLLAMMTVCQNVRLGHQLKGGVRYLDMRAAQYNGVAGIRVGHGVAWGSHFESNLPQIADFIETHPKEFVILDIGKTWTNGKPIQLKVHQQTSLTSMLIKYFDDYMVKSTDTWFRLANATMGDLWRHSKRILVLVDDHLLHRRRPNPDENPDTPHDNLRRLGLWPKDSMIHGRWANTNNKNDMYNKISEGAKHADPNKLHLSQLILTPDVLNIDIEEMTLDMQQSKILRSYVNKSGRMNIVSMDFIFGTEESTYHNQTALIDDIINRNRKL